MDAFFPRWGKWRRTSTGDTATRNRNIFLRLSPQLMICWVRSPKSYSLLWVDSWPQKWKKPFFTLRVGLTAGSQSRLQGRTPRWYVELGSQVPYFPGSQTGIRFRDWAWQNKFLAPKYFRAHLRTLNHLNPSLPLFLCNALRAHNIPHNGRTWQSLWVRTQMRTQA